MINRIPSDVLEIVVVYSRSYDLFINLKEIVERYKDERVQTRIRDKLTVKRVDVINCGIYYELNNRYYRAYNKPFYISAERLPSSIYFSVYRRIKDQCNLDLPDYILASGVRGYNNRFFSVKEHTYFKYQIGFYRFYECGKREIGCKTVNILEV